MSGVQPNRLQEAPSLTIQQPQWTRSQSHRTCSPPIQFYSNSTQSPISTIIPHALTSMSLSTFRHFSNNWLLSFSWNNCKSVNGRPCLGLRGSTTGHWLIGLPLHRWRHQPPPPTPQCRVANSQQSTKWIFFHVMISQLWTFRCIFSLFVNY